MAALLSRNHPQFFLVALQVHNDSQIRRHSPWQRIEAFIEWAMFSFAQHAPEGSVLVIKHHPMDRGHTCYGPAIRACAQRLRVASRVIYLHDAHLPTLLPRCSGLVTINSTAGLQALSHGVPVVALGRCFYAKDGITYQGCLDDFWRSPGTVDRETFTRFRQYVIRASQVNSSFYADTTLGAPTAAPSRRLARRSRFARVLSPLLPGLDVAYPAVAMALQWAWMCLTV